MSAFSSRGGREEKLRCAYQIFLIPASNTNDNAPAVAFKVYDMDRDDYISNGELFLVLKMMVGNNLKVSFLLWIPKTIRVDVYAIGRPIAANRR